MVRNEKVSTLRPGDSDSDAEAFAVAGIDRLLLGADSPYDHYGASTR